MATLNSYRDLAAWQKSMTLVEHCYSITQEFPASELYGLTSQVRRAAVSIPANIAEGFPKRGPSDKTRFFNIAQGSLEESHYYLILAKDLGYGDSANLLTMYDEVARLLNGYASAILTSNS